ncbi:unnamed protein product, partial [Porites evermanni]
QGIQIGIRNPSSTDEESEIQYLESGIHGVESRIQDCLGFRYMGREEKCDQSLYWKQARIRGVSNT